MKSMMALSFWQPYAWLIVNSHAEVDSRTWAPPEKRIGERIAIHASKRKVTRAEFENFLQVVRDQKIANYPKSPDEFDYGMLVGTVVLAGVTKNSNSYWAASGYFHWILESPKKIKPQPMKGRMGWFKISI